MHKKFYEDLIKEIPLAYAYHKMVYNDLGVPIDYVFLDVNAAFEEMTSMKASEIIGKKVTEVIPTIKTDSFDWITAYSEISDGKSHKQFEIFADSLGRFFKIYASSSKKDYFTTIFLDITDDIKRTQEQVALYTIINDILIELDDNFTVLNLLAPNEEFIIKPKEDIIGKNIIAFMPKELVDILVYNANKAKKTRKKVTFEYTTQSNNKAIWFKADCIYTNILKEGRYLLFITDITDKYDLELKLKQSESLFRTLFEQAPIGISLVKDYKFISTANNEFLRIVGMTKTQLAKIDWTSITHPDDLEEDSRLFQQFKNNEIPSYTMVKRILRNDDTVVWVYMVLTHLILDDPEDKSKTHVCMLSDISQMIQATNALKESERSKSVILSHLPGIAYRCEYDEYWTMRFISDGCLALTGYPAEALLNNNEISFKEIIAPEYRQEVSDEWDDVVRLHTYFKGEYEIITASGQRKWVYEQGQCVYDEQGNPSFLEGLIIDISESKKTALEIAFLNSHDKLTNLYNRGYFINELQRLDKQEYFPLSLIVSDINGVRLVNNAFGTDRGDRLILKIAEILKHNCREQDIIARIGGDDFGVLLPNTNSETVAEIVKNIRMDCEKLVISPSMNPMLVSLSLGYATKYKESEDINLVYREAEDFMYKRKLLDRKSSHNNILSSIMATLFEKSEETEKHAHRLFELSRKIGDPFNLKTKDLELLQLFALLHDVGKIGIDNRILKKPGKLTDAEWIEMKTHPEIGFKIAISSPELESIADLILTHHESFDGKGYPKGLKGDQIPLLSRILAVADTYDSITHDRIYRKADTKEAAIKEINRCSGTQFDPLVVDAFNKVMQS